MNDANRDLLVLSKTSHLNDAEKDQLVDLLNKILFHTENWKAFCTANEIIDINRRKIIRKSHLIQKILSEKNQKAFVFTSNKN